MGLLNLRVRIQLPTQEVSELCSFRSWEIIPDAGSLFSVHVYSILSLCIVS